MSRGTIRLVVTSDNHLNRFYDRMAPLKLAERRRRLRAGFQRAVEHALDQQVDLFVQAGDLFDTPDPRNIDRAFVAAQLARLRRAGITVIGIAGNHDTPKQRTEHGGAVPQEIYRELGGLDLLDGDRVVTRTLEIGDLRLAVGALPWSPMLTADDDPLATLDWAPEADVRLFLFHHSIEGHIYPAANEPIVKRASLDRLEGAHLLIAGHVHEHAHWQLGPLTVLVPGATEQMTFGETGQPGFCLVELSPAGVERLDHVRVEHQPRHRTTIRTTELEGDGDDLCAAVLRRIEGACDPDLLHRLYLEGPITRDGYRGLDLRRLWEFGVERNFSFDVDTAGLVVQDEFGNRPAGGVRLSQREELAACADGLIAASDDPTEKELLEATKRELLAFYERGGAA